MPRFQRWPDFYAAFDDRYAQGDHITIVGGTGSGKTILGRNLILLRQFVVVFATKVRDDSLYRPLMREGFELTTRFPIPGPKDKVTPTEHPKVIFKPNLEAPTSRAMSDQAEEFQEAILYIWKTGYWTVFGDEIRYLTQTLGLGSSLGVLWLQGRSLGVSIVVTTQRPRSIPQEAFSQATHLFLFRENDFENTRRTSEFAGADVDLVRWVLPRLPRHEALYIDTRDGYMRRTKVIV